MVTPDRKPYAAVERLRLVLLQNSAYEPSDIADLDRIAGLLERAELVMYAATPHTLNSAAHALLVGMVEELRAERGEGERAY